MPPSQIGMGRCVGNGANPAPTTRSNVPSCVTDRSVHKRRSSPICSSSRRPGAEAETEASFAEDVHLGGLLREQGGLALWGDDDAGHELQLGDPCQEPVEDKRLVEGRIDVI